MYSGRRLENGAEGAEEYRGAGSLTFDRRLRNFREFSATQSRIILDLQIFSSKFKGKCFSPQYLQIYHALKYSFLKLC